MSKTIETQAKTIDAAIEDALKILNASYDEVEVEVISNGGMFKKAKVRVTKKTADAPEPKPEPKPDPKPAPKDPAVAKPEATSTPAASKPEQKLAPKTESKPERPKKQIDPSKTGIKFTKTFDFVKTLIELLGNDSVVTSEHAENGFNININGENVGRLIGKGGDVLNAMQTIVSSIAISNSNGENERVFVNVGDYKERRVETLKSLAKKKADYVRTTGRYVKLEPMSSRDRAIIHTELQGADGIRTYSTGKDPHRCLCIAPARENQEEPTENE